MGAQLTSSSRRYDSRCFCFATTSVRCRCSILGAIKLCFGRPTYAPNIVHGIPLNHWFHGPLKNFMRGHLSAGQLNRRGLFEYFAVGQLIDEHVARSAVEPWRLLALMTATVWLDAVLSAPGASWSLRRQQ